MTTDDRKTAVNAIRTIVDRLDDFDLELLEDVGWLLYFGRSHPHDDFVMDTADKLVREEHDIREDMALSFIEAGTIALRRMRKERKALS